MAMRPPDCCRESRLSNVILVARGRNGGMVETNQRGAGWPSVASLAPSGCLPRATLDGGDNASMLEKPSRRARAPARADAFLRKAFQDLRLNPNMHRADIFSTMATMFPIFSKAPRRRAAAPASGGDPLSRAFQAFGLDPNKSEDRDELLELMAERLFGLRRTTGTTGRSGRPTGTTGPNKLSGAWYLRLVIDAAEIRQRHPTKLSQENVARLLRKTYPKRYGPVSIGRLRQHLSLHSLLRQHLK
jgi:hypothetical protein